jgi:hypothetical protein
VAAGLITREQLAEVLQAQVLYGGSLGANLLELKYLDERALVRFFNESLGYGQVSDGVLESVDEGTLQLLAPDLAGEFQIVPFHFDGHSVDVAMADPTDERAIAEVGLATRRTVRAYCARASILATALKRYYQVTWSPGSSIDAAEPSVLIDWEGLRAGAHGGAAAAGEPFPTAIEPQGFANTLAVESPPPPRAAGKGAPMISVPAGPTTLPFASTGGEASTPPAGMPAAALPLRASEEDVIEEILDLLRGEASQEAPERRERISIGRTLGRLQRARDRNEIGEIAVAFTAGICDRAVLLLLRGKTVTGWMGRGGSLSKRKIRGVMLPLSYPSIFRWVLENRTAYVGKLPRDRLNELYLATLGEYAPIDAILYPIVAHEQVFCLVYGDRRAQPFSQNDRDELLALSRATAQAFEALLNRSLDIQHDAITKEP